MVNVDKYMAYIRIRHGFTPAHLTPGAVAQPRRGRRRLPGQRHGAAGAAALLRERGAVPAPGVPSGVLRWLKPCHKPPIWKWFIEAIYGIMVIWGMVDDCSIISV